MTLSEAVQSVRDLLLERPGEIGLADDDKIGRVVNIANRAVWKRAMAVKPDQWLYHSPELTYSLTDGLTFDAIAEADAALAQELAQQFGQSDMAGLDYVELKGGDQRWYSVLPLHGGRDRSTIEPLYNKQNAGLLPPPFRWYVSNLGIFLTPPPNFGPTCRVTWAPVIPQAGADDALLWGRYAHHHDAVVFKAAVLLYATDEGQSTPWDREYKEAMDLFLIDLEGGGQSMQTRRVSPRGPFNP